MKFSSFIEKQLIDNNLDSIILTDKDCIIEYANKAAIQLYGYDMEELTGKHINVFEVPGKEIQAEAWASLRQTGKWAGEGLRQKKDGSFFHASLSIFTLYDEGGKIIGFAGNTKDINQTILITDALIEKQYQLKSIVDNTVDIIVSIDKDLNVLECNQVLANLVKEGLGHEVKRGDALLNYIDPSKHDTLKNIYAKVFTGERVSDIEIFKASDGSFIYFESSYNPIYSEDKTVKGISIFSKNITDRVKSEQQLKKAFEEKEILLSEIHHRIKNNLAIISSVLQLQEININNEEAIKCLRESRMRIKSAALLHEMLYQNNSLDKVCVKEYLSNMFNDINNSIGNQEHKLRIAGDDASLLIHNAIPAGLLFNEIFTNSIKHGFKGITHGEIDVIIKNEGRCTLFEISENTAKFPEEITIENSHSTGLLLIKSFTEQLNGTIKLLKKPKTSYLLSLDLSC
jgi:PAS domain S-box-containing protein